MCLNETRLDNHISDHELNIDNYSLVRKDRSRKGGGVALYVHETLAFNVCTDLNNDDLELLWCKINPKHQASFLLCCFYCSPSISVVQSIYISSELTEKELSKSCQKWRIIILHQMLDQAQNFSLLC